MPHTGDVSAVLGTWRLQSYVREVLGTGERYNQFGEELDGYIGYSPDNRMYAIFTRGDRITPSRPDDLPLVRSALGESGHGQFFVRNALVPDGRLLQCSWQPIQGGGAVRGGLVAFTDMTELQRLQAEQVAQFAQLQETQRKLIESQRIGRVGNKSWTLEHEIRDATNEELLATASTVNVFYDYEKGQSVRIPDDIVEMMEQFEGRKLRG